MVKAEYERFLAHDREEWRAWLAAHHDRSPGVWLVTYKKPSGKPHLPYVEAVEEALCFGWIDSLPRKLDDERTMRLVTPRRRGSPWSRVNKGYVARLEAEGRMAEAGRAAVARARADGSWDAADETEDLTEPDDLRAGLDADPEARRNWDRFPPSSHKGILWWLQTAKGEVTRARRLREIVGKAAENRKANFPEGRDAGPKPP